MFEIYRNRVDLEEIRSGAQIKKPKDMPFYQALDDPDTRAEYIRRECLGGRPSSGLTVSTDLQRLQWWTEAFMTTITQSAQRMPYSMRFMARETLAALRVSYYLCYSRFELIEAFIGKIPRYSS